MSASRRLLALVASLALLGAARSHATVFDLADDVGKPVPALTLPEAGGGALSLAALRGEPTYLFLFASWCEPCKIAFPFIRSAYAKYGDRVRFIGVDVLEDAAAARAAVASEHFPFPVAIYPIEALDATIAPQLQLQAGWKYKIPSDFLIDANGVVRYAWHGVPVDDRGTPIDVLPSYLAKLGVQ
jgi:thiol-disulfide isomerase/thioredoxin